MQYRKCLTFHELFEYLNHREAGEQFEQHIASCERCRGELEFIRKIHHAVQGKHKTLATTIQPEPTDHIDVELQEQYYKNALAKKERKLIDQHLMACDDCLHEFATAAKDAQFELNEQDLALIKQIESIEAGDRLQPYRQYFMSTPTFSEYLAQKFDSIRAYGQWFAWGHAWKAATVGAVMFLAFFTYRALDHQLTDEAGHAYYSEQAGKFVVGRNDLQPSDPNVKVKLFDTRSKEDKESTSLTEPTPLQEALKVKPNDARLNHMMGTLYFFSGQMDLAEVHYRRALEADPQNARIYNDLALIYFDRKDYSESQRLLQRALEFDSTLAQAHYNWAMVLEFKGEKDNAVAAWTKYIEEIDTNPESQWRTTAQLHKEDLSR